MTCDDPRTRRVVDFFETLAPQTLHQLPTVYADDVHFKDPFNAIRGHAPLMAIFQHMFDGVQHPRFVVTEAICQGDQAFLVWDFHFERQGLPSPMAIHGSTHIRFAADGRVNWHRDYWDAAEELYCKLPVIGAVFRWLQRYMG